MHGGWLNVLSRDPRADCIAPLLPFCVIHRLLSFQMGERWLLFPWALGCTSCLHGGSGQPGCCCKAALSHSWSGHDRPQLPMPASWTTDVFCCCCTYSSRMLGKHILWLRYELSSVCVPSAGGQFGLDPLYTPVKLLGRGGTGATWLCQETSTGKQVR